MGQLRRIGLSWTGGGRVFRGESQGGAPVTIDGDSKAGPGPMETLLFSLAGCTGSDIVDILEKMRVPLTRLDVQIEGERAETQPRRYVRILARYVTEGVAEADEAKLRRAVELSVDRYCSVLHSLRRDIEFTSEIVRR
ncbi:MAG: OsmC family protein [Gemmatimonadetes bacterium]|nr:OsmC family protein [Gemmatimonadota bacterium]